GLMPCGGSGNAPVLSDYRSKPWPEEMKAFLSSELADFPGVASLDSIFQGFYLSDTTLSDDIDENSNVHIDGLTCQVGQGGKFIVFINYDVHVRERGKYGKLDRFQNVSGLTDRYTMQLSPDTLIATIVHELFHVIDFGRFASRTTGEPTSKRSALADYSWSSPDTPIYDRIGILYLT